MKIKKYQYPAGKLGDVSKIARYNLDHGTHFFRMDQVLEHDKQQALQNTQSKKRTIWDLLATGAPESSGEAILNKSIEVSNNSELPETRQKIYNDTGKAELATTASSLLTLPILGEFSTYGLLGGTARVAGGFGGSALGSYGLGKAGDYADSKLGTNWIGNTGRVVGGFAGWGPGSSLGYGALNVGKGIGTNLKNYFVASNIKHKHPKLIQQVSIDGRGAKSLIDVWNNNTGQAVQYDPKLIQRARKVNSALLYGKDPQLEAAAALYNFKSKILSNLGVNKNVIGAIDGVKKDFITSPLSKKLLAAKNLPENITLYTGKRPKQLNQIGYGQEHEVYIDGNDVIKFKFHRNPVSYAPHSKFYSTLTNEELSTGAHKYPVSVRDFIPERKYLGSGIDDGGQLVPVFKERFIEGSIPTQQELNNTFTKYGIDYDGFGKVTFKNGSVAQDVNPKNVKIVDGKPVIIDPITTSAYNPNSRYYFYKPKPLSRPISLAERLGIPKGERSSLTEDQLQALDDLLWYKQNGRYKSHFYFDEVADKFRWGTPASKKDSEIDGVKALVDHGAAMKSVDRPVRLSTQEGNFVIWPGKNAAYTSNFPIPEGMKWGPGETNLMLVDDAGHEMKTILTSPRVDLANSMEDAPKELLESLPNTIDKNIMKQFWSTNEEMIKPGTYLSGDNKRAPLGSYAISAFDKNKSFTEGLSKILYPEFGTVGGKGLSPDSYSSIIRQAQRGNKKLRWGQGYTRWNDSAVENAQIYKDWKRMIAGEITPEEYKEIFDTWAIPLGGRPLEIKVSSPFSLVKNNDGTFSKIAQQQKKTVIIPHPYIMYRKQGGILKGQNSLKLPSETTVPAPRSTTSVVTPLTPGKIALSPVDESWEVADHDPNIYEYNPNGDRYVKEFFEQDVLPRYTREHPNASQKEIDAVRKAYSDKQYMEPIDSNVAGYADPKYRSWNFGIPSNKGSQTAHYNTAYKLSRPTLVHENTHLYRQGRLGYIHKNVPYIGKTFFQGSGYSTDEVDRLQKAYDMRGYDFSNYGSESNQEFARTIESGTTNAEVRYLIWKELYDKLGRVPTLDETDEYLRNYNKHALWRLVSEANGYGRQAGINQVNDIIDAEDREDKKERASRWNNYLLDALIHVASNNQMPDKTKLARFGGVLKRRNG